MFSFWVRGVQSHVSACQMSCMTSFVSLFCAHLALPLKSPEREDVESSALRLPVVRSTIPQISKYSEGGGGGVVYLYTNHSISHNNSSTNQ